MKTTSKLAALSRLERAAIAAWVAWGDYAKHTLCDRCDAPDYCRARSAHGTFLCLTCFDLGPEGER